MRFNDGSNARWNLHQTIVLLGLIAFIPWHCCLAMTEQRRLELKEMTKEMFFHGWNNYLKYGYPEDELNPILCNGRGSDKENPANININDVLGDYSLTLVDTLDTLAILGEQEEFERAVNLILRDVSFDRDNKVQVFELNIRALGGLLSGHILASDPSYGHAIKGYKGGLLRLAEDLAKRLVPAFQLTKTGLPYPRVNLRYGVPRNEIQETCTAGAGSLILEFGVLSRLTGNYYYENVAKKALKALWDRRSEINLLGNVINIHSGHWIHTASSTGAGIDSFFEYLLKAYILFGETEYLEIFNEAYDGIMRHVRDSTGYLYRNVHMNSGALMATWIDSLAAFWPGVQVLHGDIEAAVKGHLVYYNIWRRFHALPERFDYYRQIVDIGFYPLRPEFVESTYYLYRATRDPFYLQVGEMVLNDLNNRTRLPCGFASIGDVRTGRLEDRMESFLLSETLKYLYLLFDDDNAVNSLDSSFVFTTEGHFLPLPKQYLFKSEPSFILPPFTCPAPLKHASLHPNQLDMSSIPYTSIADFAAAIVGRTDNTLDVVYPKGECTSPLAHMRNIELKFNADPRAAMQTVSPKLIQVVGGFLSKSLSGLRVELSKRSRKEGGGYQVVRVDPEARVFDANQTWTITVDALAPYLEGDMLQLVAQDGSIVPWMENDIIEIRVHGSDASYMYHAVQSDFGESFPELTNQKLVAYIIDEDKFTGCEPYTRKERKEIQGKVLVVSRGDCTFSRKAFWAQEAGAAAVLFVNNQPDQEAFRAEAAPPEPDMPQDMKVTIPSATLTLDDGAELLTLAEADPALTMDILNVPKTRHHGNVFHLLLHGSIVHNILVLAQ